MPSISRGNGKADAKLLLFYNIGKLFDFLFDNSPDFL